MRFTREEMVSRRKEWFDNEDFWRDFYPVMFPRSRFDSAADEIDKVIALAGVRSGAVLDLCCGPGRHSVELARRGYRVTGVDTTRFLLDKARRRARRSGVKVEWVPRDMRDFRKPNTYDLALSLFTSFGYFDNMDDDVAVLRSLRENLRDGGVLVMDMVGKEVLARIFQATTSTYLDDGTLLIQRHAIFDNWSRVRNEWMLVRDGRVRTHTFHHTLYSARELEERLFAAGFGTVAMYGDLDGHAYGPGARRLVAVARVKPFRAGRRGGRGGGRG